MTPDHATFISLRFARLEPGDFECLDGIAIRHLRIVAGADGGCARQSLERSQNARVERVDLFGAVTRQPRIQIELDQVIGPEAKIGGTQVVHRAQEEACGGQQEYAERDLRAYGKTAQQQRAAGDGDVLLLQCRGQIRPPELQCRRQAEEHAGHKRDRERDEEQPPVKRRRERRLAYAADHQPAARATR